jgi:hypothetical protein
VTFADTFAQSSIKGALTRGSVAWLLITPAVAAAKVWWSGIAAVVVGVVLIAAYVAFATRYVRRHRPRPAA